MDVQPTKSPISYAQTAARDRMIESWRKVWREGAAPKISTKGLEALKQALVSDDVRLIQGATTTPPPLHCVLDWPCEAACLIGYCGWKEGLNTVGEVEEYFARICFEADQALGEPAAVRYLLNYFDDTPRNEMRKELLSEVERELQIRNNVITITPIIVSTQTRRG